MVKPAPLLLGGLLMDVHSQRFLAVYFIDSPAASSMPFSVRSWVAVRSKFLVIVTNGPGRTKRGEGQIRE